MPIAVIVCALLLVCIGFLFAGYSRAQDTGKASVSYLTCEKVRSLSKEQIAEKLKELDVREAPKPKMGAMCYDMAAPPKRAEYLCPTCGEKTLYTKDNAEFVAWELESCRREFGSFNNSAGLCLALDESSFCIHCSPKSKEHSLTLTVTYTDSSTHTTSSVSLHDLLILKAFVNGGSSFATFNEGSQPLKEELPRLRELLGLKPDCTKIQK